MGKKIVIMKIKLIIINKNKANKWQLIYFL